MERYSVYTLFKNGQDYQFETNTNVLNLEPIQVNGAQIIMTKDEHGINMNQVKKMEVVWVGHGKIGEIVNG